MYVCIYVKFTIFYILTLFYSLHFCLLFSAPTLYHTKEDWQVMLLFSMKCASVTQQLRLRMLKWQEDRQL